MKAKAFCLAAGLVVAVGLSADARAIDKDEINRLLRKRGLPVSVGVDAPESYVPRITSYVTRELRSLPDVTVTTDEEAPLKLVVVAREEKLPDRMIGVIVVGFVLEKSLPLEILGLLQDQGLITPQGLEIIKKLPPGPYTMVDYLIYYGLTSQLKDICEALVAQFDGTVLEEKRRSVERTINLLVERHHAFLNPTSSPTSQPTERAEAQSSVKARQEDEQGSPR